MQLLAQRETRKERALEQARLARGEQGRKTGQVGTLSLLTRGYLGFATERGNEVRPEAQLAGVAAKAVTGPKAGIGRLQMAATLKTSP